MLPPIEAPKRLYRCKGGCGTVYSNRNPKRTLRHARYCWKLSDDLCLRVKAQLANLAPSRKLLSDDPECSKTDIENDETRKAGGSTFRPQASGAEDEGKVVAAQKRKSNQVLLFFQTTQKLGTRDCHNKLDLAIVKFISPVGFFRLHL